MPKGFRLMTCRRCGAQENRGARGKGAYFCFLCSFEHITESVRASYHVKAARSRGVLPSPTDCLCTDCGEPAAQYDHRDYTEPLRVDPVCRSCNVKRGPAFDSKYRPQPLAA